MQINRLTLRNFRNIGDTAVDFYFNPQFTVVIGVNGKGKSTVLNGLRLAAGVFLSGIPEINKKRNLRQEDIRTTYEGYHERRHVPVLVEASGYMEDSTEVVWRRQIEKLGGSTTSREADVGPLKRLGVAKFTEIERGNNQIPLPVIAFFGTERLHGAGRNRSRDKDKIRMGRRIFEEGYKNWDELKSSTFGYENWLATYDGLVSLEREYPNTKAAFLQAVRDANRNITRLEVFNGKLWLQVKIDGFESDFMPLALQSDGIIIFTEMVAELAYRCVVLNGYKDREAVTESEGVVMIDEIDLHLHPTWQRHVVEDLKNAFPKLQFVVTTHSPFIVQSLESDEIWNLDKIMDVAPNDYNLNTVATEIMGVPSAYSTENTSDYDQAKRYLEQLKNPSTDLSGLQLSLNEIDDPAVRAFLELQSNTR